MYLGYETGSMPVSYAGLRALPGDPQALDGYLGRLHLPGWGPAPFREFEIIVRLLTTYVMPPALTAELYRSLGLIPGVTVNHHAVDIAGRTGSASRSRCHPGSAAAPTRSSSTRAPTA